MIKIKSWPKTRKPPQDLKKIVANVIESWYCDQCQVEVYERRCPHCGKTEREKT